MSIVLLYITLPDADQAKAMARALLDERLIACANILGSVTSLYRWEGALQEAQEVVLIAKTTPENTDRAISRAKALHTYACPCIVALPVTTGYLPFLDWIAEETS